MSKPKNDKWKDYIRGLETDDLRKLAIVTVERLMECEEVSYRPECRDRDEPATECIYWDSCGEDIIDD